MSDPRPDQTLPEDLDEDGNPKPVAPNQDLPTEQPPKGEGQNRGRDEEARRNAPGQQKKDEA